MVFDGDPHAGIDGPAALRLQHLDRVFNSCLDAAFALAVFAVAENNAKNRRAERVGYSNTQGEVFFRRAPILSKSPGRWADTPTSQMNLQPLVPRRLSNVLQITVIQFFKRSQVGNEKRVGPERGRVVDQLRRFPTHPAHGEIVDAEFHTAATRGGRLAVCWETQSDARSGEGGDFDELAPGQFRIIHGLMTCPPSAAITIADQNHLALKL